MESKDFSPKHINLSGLCKEILSDQTNLEKYIGFLSKNPNWIEENCERHIDITLLCRLIDKAYENKKYIIVLYGITDILCERFITDEVFTRLISYPTKDIKDAFIIQLSHKALSESQLLELCKMDITFECYFELAILYYENSDFSFDKLKNFLYTFKNSKFSYMYGDLLQELFHCNSSNSTKKRWISSQLLKI